MIIMIKSKKLKNFQNIQKLKNTFIDLIDKIYKNFNQIIKVIKAFLITIIHYIRNNKIYHEINIKNQILIFIKKSTLISFIKYAITLDYSIHQEYLHELAKILRKEYIEKELFSFENK